MPWCNPLPSLLHMLLSVLHPCKRMGMWDVSTHPLPPSPLTFSSISALLLPQPSISPALSLSLSLSLALLPEPVCKKTRQKTGEESKGCRCRDPHLPSSSSPQTVKIDEMLISGISLSHRQDGKRSAQFEHTLLVTETGCDILTLRPDDGGRPHFMSQM